MPRPHVLLVNPWIHDFAAYDFWARPLGLLQLAGLLREAGCRVSLVDCLAPRGDRRRRFGRGPYPKTPLPKPAALADVPRRFSRYGIAPAQLRRELSAAGSPELILVTSMMTYWYPGVQETIAELRRAHPGVPVVLGGVYASLCAEHARRHAGADLVVAGPGEAAVLELVAGITGCGPPPGFDPLVLDTHPRPALDLQPQIDWVPLLTGRGCPFRCAYCAAHRLAPKRLTRSPEAVIEEIRFWHRSHGVVDFVLYDDAFLVDAERHALPLLEKIAESGLKLRFHTPNALHVRGITAAVAHLLRRAGFETLRLGLETTDFEGRRRLDRKLTAAEFRRAAAALKAAGFDGRQVGAYLLAGLPGQRIEQIAAAIRTVRQAGITPIPAYYTPIPGTGLWPAAVAASRYDLAADPIFTNNAILPCRKTPFSWEFVTRLKQLAAG